MTFWNNENVDFLKKHHMAHSAGEIAKMLGVTRNTVLGKVTRMVKSGDLIKKPVRKQLGPRFKKAKKAKKLAPKIITKAPSSLEVTTPEPESKKLNLIQLKPNDCRWTPDSYLFCGHKQKPGSPYCQHHYERTHTPSKYVKSTSGWGQ